MNKILIASLREGAGKTSVIVGITSAVNKKYGYIKPLGDRLIYRKKRNWDYDSILMLDILNIDDNPENFSLGFYHSKLKYVYDEKSMKDALVEMVEKSAISSNILFIEGGKDIAYGASINLDSISVSKYTDSKLVLIVSGNDDTIMDDIKYMHKYIDIKEINFAGVIINKVQNVEDFKTSYLQEINKMGVNVLGIIPYNEELIFYTVDLLAERLFANVIAGDSGLNNVVKNIFVGAMSTETSLRNPMFNKNNKLFITSGDRSDMILTALESDTSGIVLSNNIMPTANIISRANELGVPLLLCIKDTYQISKQVDGMEALITKNNKDKIGLLAQTMKEYVDIDQTIG